MLIGGHGRCNNPDYNAKYLHYTIVDQKASKIVGLLLTQKKVKEVLNSSGMGKIVFTKVLQDLTKENLVIMQFTFSHLLQNLI